MEVTATGLIMVPVTLLAAGALLWAVVVILRAGASPRPISECLLGAGTITFLVLNAEVHALSFLPGERPLDWLPLCHTALTLGLIGYTLRTAGATAWRESFLVCFHGLRALVRAAGAWLTGALVAVGSLLLIYFVYGAYTVPGAWGAGTVLGAWDVLSHHLPMALQPYQDGRLGPVLSDLPWADAYPRGVHLLWYWTLQWTGTDLLVHPVQLGFGVRLLLATYVLARRTGVAPWAAVLAAIMLATMPVFVALTTSGYIDIAVAAAAVAAVAFLAPPRARNQPLTRDWPLAAAAVAESCLIRLPALALAFAGLAWLQSVLLRRALRSSAAETLRFFSSPRGGLSGAVIVLACHTYVTNWLEHGNPLYPVAVRYSEHTLFPGPLDPAVFYDLTGLTSMGNVKEMPSWQRFWAGWTDFRQPLAMDSFGSFGPVFVIGAFVPFLIFVLRGITRRNSWCLTLGLMFVLCFWTPAYVPRYGLPMIAVAIVGAAWTFTHLPASWRLRTTLFVLSLCTLGALASLVVVSSSVKWIIKEAGGTLPLKSRNAFLFEKRASGWPGHCSPEMIRFIRANSGAGDTLVWNAMTFHGLLWNKRYSNRVIHVPGTPGEIWPAAGDGPSARQLAAWLEQIERLAPKHILVYTKSDYAVHLRRHPALGYCVTYADPASRPYAMSLFERVPPVPTD